MESLLFSSFSVQGHKARLGPERTPRPPSCKAPLHAFHPLVLPFSPIETTTLKGQLEKIPLEKSFHMDLVRHCLHNLDIIKIKYHIAPMSLHLPFLEKMIVVFVRLPSLVCFSLALSGEGAPELHVAHCVTMVGYTEFMLTLQPVLHGRWGVVWVTFIGKCLGSV